MQSLWESEVDWFTFATARPKGESSSYRVRALGGVLGSLQVIPEGVPNDQWEAVDQRPYRQVLEAGHINIMLLRLQWSIETARSPWKRCSMTGRSDDEDATVWEVKAYLGTEEESKVERDFDDSAKCRDAKRYQRMTWEFTILSFLR